MRKTVLVVLTLCLASSFALAKDPELPLYSNDSPGQPFLILGSMNVTALSVDGVRKKMKRDAAKMGAEAVLNYAVTPTADTVGASGVAVRWAKEGEVGMTSITPGTPIPVIK